jgi:hypothetical protein
MRYLLRSRGLGHKLTTPGFFSKSIPQYKKLRWRGNVSNASPFGVRSWLLRSKRHYAHTSRLRVFRIALHRFSICTLGIQGLRQFEPPTFLAQDYRCLPKMIWLAKQTLSITHND